MGKHLQSRSACFCFCTTVSFVFASNICKFIAKSYKLSIFKTFQDKSDTSSLLSHSEKAFVSWCLLNCSQGVVSATDWTLLSNVHPMGSIVEKVIIYEKKEICSSHPHHKFESDSQKAKFCGCVASADLLLLISAVELWDMSVSIIHKDFQTQEFKKMRKLAVRASIWKHYRYQSPHLMGNQNCSKSELPCELFIWEKAPQSFQSV